ncbi:MAG TPA: cyclic nucleotide-binding domain-containing protein [Desulfobacteraceae bacterium]|nr:cyclic nucleotide-binding domain-containing protein [Desulfobacteraceae bacterium]
MGVLRFAIPLGYTIIYPLFYVMKAQFETLFILMFWNLANDLFNTRQSKRIFPLLTAGGVVGGMIGSFATPSLAKLISMDNLMLAYAVTASLGALTVKTMGVRFPSLLVSKKRKKGQKRASFVQEFKDVWPLVKQSLLVKILIFLTLLPNILIPIMNYLFAYTVNNSFATQGGMLTFYGYFRGSMNIISLIILLFVGRVYGRWGLPIVLMFHPFNYILAFLAFLLKFDIFSAMYARVSTNVLRTTMNNPARAVLMGLFPVEYRATIRPFLRGTVVRIGILTGAGMIMVSEGIFHPRYLSIFAMIVGGLWVVTGFVLKKNYSKILLDLISKNLLDLKTLEEKDVNSVFADKKIQTQMMEALVRSRGDKSLWYARLLRDQPIDGFDRTLLPVIRDNDDKTATALLDMLSPNVGEEALPVFRELADPAKKERTIAVLRAVNRMSPAPFQDFLKEIFESSGDPEIQAYAVVGLYRQSPQAYQGVIDAWLKSDDASEKRAGVIAAGQTGDGAYIPRLEEMLNREEDESLLPHLLTALHRLGAPSPNRFATTYLYHPEEAVRIAALDAFELGDDDAVRTIIRLMDDPSERVFDLAKEKIQTAPHQNAQILVESLNIPRRKVREGIFDLLALLNIKDLDIFRFARSGVERCYHYLAEIESLRNLPEGQERDLIIDHLGNKKQIELENVLRVLATEDQSGQMRIIWRGLFSSESRRRSNSLEALDDLLDASLSSIMLPLLEGGPPTETLKTGRKHFKLPDFGTDQAAVVAHLLKEQDWVTVVLTLYLVSEQGRDGVDRETLRSLAGSENRHIRQMAQRAMDKEDQDPVKLEEMMETETSIPEKILRLKSINIFEGLAASELAAIASVTEEVEYPAGDIVIKEGEAGETMFLILKGTVAVIKGEGEEGVQEIELARIGAGDYFGEMALFEDAVRSATIRTAEDSRFLVLHKQEFTEIVREYPQIALHICKALSSRIRQLHEKIKS